MEDQGCPMYARQAGIKKMSASDRGFSENFGLKTRISIFCDLMCRIFVSQHIFLKAIFGIKKEGN